MNFDINSRSHPGPRHPAMLICCQRNISYSSVEVRIPLNQLGVQRINLKFERKNVILDMPSLCCSHIKSQVCGMKLQLSKKLRHSGDNMFTSVSVYETCVCLCHSFSCCSMFETLSRRMLRGAGSYVGITQFGFSQRNSWRTCL